MANLFKRATPPQKLILRIIKGNEADAHGRERDFRTARSIAKRATGTLTAQWPEVLAAGRYQVGEKPADLAKQARKGAQLRKRLRRGGGRLNLTRRSPLAVLWQTIAMQMRHLKCTGQLERYEAYKDILRLIDSLMKEG